MFEELLQTFLQKWDMYSDNLLWVGLVKGCCTHAESTQGLNLRETGMSCFEV